MVVFSSAFYFLSDTVNRPPSSTFLFADERNFQSLAEGLSSELLTSGQGWYAGPSCTGAGVANTASMAPEQVGTLPTSRFGLGEESCDRHAATAQGFNNISFTKLSDIHQAQTASDPANGHVDYEEARTSLGLVAAGLDFHLRTWLIPSSIQEIIATGLQDAYLRVVYVGDYEPEEARSVPHSKGVVNNADHVILYVRVTNDAPDATILGVTYSLPLDRGTMEFTLHTPVLTQGQSYNLTVTIRKTSDWKWDGDATAYYTIGDAESSIQSGTIDMSGVAMTYATQRNTQVVWADAYSYKLSGASVSGKTNYASWDGTGRTTTFTDWTHRLYGPPLGLVLSTSVLPNVDDGTVTSSLVATGTFTARLQNDLLLSTWNQDTVNVLAADPLPYDGGEEGFDPEASVPVEARFIDALVQGFDPYAYSSTYNDVLLPYSAGGDVYPDVGDALEDDLADLLVDSNSAPSLKDVTTIVVGSNVDHHAANSPQTRAALAAWVRAGGTLIVLGSDPQSMHWLKGLFDASFNDADEAMSADDGSHPILSVPNDIDYLGFVGDTQVSFQDDDASLFTTILRAGSEDAFLAVSKDGSFGTGRVILTGWKPYELTADQAATCATPFTPATNCQGLSLLHNMMTMSYRQLFVDFGPTPSGTQSSGSSLRIVSVYHPDLQATVSLAMRVTVFPRGG